jgi:hypothetical protein
MGKRANRLFLSVFPIGVLPLLVTRSSGGGVPSDEYSAELFSTTKVFYDQVLGDLIEVTADGMFHFSEATAGVTKEG